ncbi:MAG TPA: hypothetical protein VL335_00250 [Candidatus Paceibacterota bacterium]|jgi:hypothetical protein|nr:hypothetical protein [Candidatus Paceibacterota bacterium]
MNEENQNPSLTPQDFPTPASPETPQRPHITETPQKALRTYESDVADVLAHKKISTATIALAEQKKSTGQNYLGESAESVENKANKSQILEKLLFALAGIVLIGGGIGGAYYFYSLSPLAGSQAPAPQITAPASIVPADTHATLAVDGMNPVSIISAVRKEIAKQQENDTVKEIILVQSKNGQRFRVSGPDIASMMDISAPDILLRALSNNWMLGVYADKNGAKDIFVVASIDYFQNAFAGMLQWENVMADDLKQYFYSSAPADISTVNDSTQNTALASTSEVNGASSTPTDSYRGDSRYTVIRGTFTDRIIRNKDVREFVTANGTLFLYSFIDNNKLVITGSESTLSAILERLEQKAFVR